MKAKVHQAKKQNRHPTARQCYEMCQGIAHPSWDRWLERMKHRAPYRYESLMQGQKVYVCWDNPCRVCGSVIRLVKDCSCKQCRAEKRKGRFPVSENSGRRMYVQKLDVWRKQSQEMWEEVRGDR